MFFKTIQIQNLLGENICHIEQYLIVVEKSVVADVTTLWKAVAILITWYYIVDIVYPTECLNAYLFVEKALLNLPLSAKLSNSALQCISAMDHMELKENEQNDI